MVLFSSVLDNTCLPNSKLDVMNRDRAIAECRTRVLPFCGELVAKLNADVPRVNAQVFDGPVGSATPYDGHHFGIDCLFPEAPADEPDNVALIVDLWHREGTLQVSADVVWGEGSVEAQLLPDHTPATDEVLSAIVDGLPVLADALMTALRRGKPKA
jgi:hypothetical protein